MEKLKLLSFLLFIVSFSLSYSLSIEGVFNNKNINKSDICSTYACKESAKIILESLNESVNPCDNFFQFACGGWIEKNPVPETESLWNQFNKVDDRLLHQLKKLLESPINDSEPSGVQKSKIHYQSCLDENSIESEGLKPLLKILNSYHGWSLLKENNLNSNFDWQTMMADFSRLFFISPIIAVGVYMDRKNTSHNILIVDQPKFGIPRTILIEPEVYEKQNNAYKQLIIDTANLIHKEISTEILNQKLLKSKIDELLKFERELARLSSPVEMRRNMHRTYNSMTLRELQAWTDISSKDQINWLILIKNIFNSTNIQIDLSEKVIVREMDYLFKLMTLLENTPNMVIVDYLNWRVIQMLMRSLNSDMLKLLFKFEQVFTGALQEQPRWKLCVSSASLSLPMAVGYDYIKKYFDTSAKLLALEISDNIRNTISSEINNVNWMDLETKKAAQRKIEKMGQLIGYPLEFDNSTTVENYYNNLVQGKRYFKNFILSKEYHSWKHLLDLRKPTNRAQWPTSPAVVNAYYNAQYNSIILTAAILQPPFFRKGRTEALNYGGIGVVIGHEITHGFDDVGRQSDEFGNMRQWWSENTIETFTKKSECFIDQYSNYQVPELSEFLFSEAKINGLMTLGENIADNGGLRAALYAYRNYTKQYGDEPRLIGLEKYSGEQLFFIAFALNWCESTTKEALLHEILNDSHSPHKFRVEGSIENFEDFYKTFNCPVSKIKKQPCVIW